MPHICLYYQLSPEENSFQSRSGPVNLRPFERIHLDIKSIDTPSYGQARYFCTIVCRFSRWKEVSPLQSKIQLVSHLESWHSQFVRRHNFEVKTIRCDNGCENKNWRFREFLNHISANQEFTNPYNSQSNGIAERAHQTLWSITKTLLKDSDLPTAAWGEIVRTAAYLSNRLPTEAHTRGSQIITPYEVVFQRPPDLSHLRCIGTHCFVHDSTPTRSDTADNAISGILVGYATSTNGYRILTDRQRGTIQESANVRFMSELSQNSDTGSGEITNETNITIPHTTPTVVQSQIIPNDGITIAQDPPNLPTDNANLNINSPEDEAQDIVLPEDLINHLESELIRDSRPKRSSKLPNRFSDYELPKRAKIAKKKLPHKIPYQIAVQDERIRLSMLEELSRLFVNDAVKIVELPSDRTPLSVTWAHKFKYNQDGNFL